MAPQGWGHVLRHPSQARLGLKEEEPAEWHGLVNCKACGAGCCLGIKSGQVSHFTLKLRANTWGDRWSVDGSSSWQPSSASPSPPSVGTKTRAQQRYKTATTKLLDSVNILGTLLLGFSH